MRAEATEAVAVPCKMARIVVRVSMMPGAGMTPEFLDANRGEGHFAVEKGTVAVNARTNKRSRNSTDITFELRIGKSCYIP